MDNDMHDLKLERFYATGEAANNLVLIPDGPIKTFTLRGIKDSPPYLHDGRLLTLADTVEFFNLVLGTKLDASKNWPSYGVSDSIAVKESETSRCAASLDFSILTSD
jgi:cytochrome c peroxidase